MAAADLCRAFASLLLKTPRNSSQNLVSQCFKSTYKRTPYQRTGCVDRRVTLLKQGIDLNKYTLHPLPYPRTGGRGPDGQIWQHRVGGGHKQRYRMVDYKREGPKEGPPLEEKVLKIRYDPCRTADIAIVASGNRKRYIIASQNMKEGDVIKTSGKVTRMAVRAEEGDAHPVGSLPLGALVHNVEKYSGMGGMVARAAGTSAQLVRKIGDRCILRMPSKREIDVAQDCMVTLGRVSNVDHNKRIIGKAGRNRWFGIRPKSGWWHRKTGYHGRKIRAIKPTKTYKEPSSPPLRRYRFSL